jgi:hypothetical protein
LRINLHTLEIDEDVDEVKEDSFEDVYVEASSRELARSNAINFCLSMSNNFNFAAQEIAALRQEGADEL